VDTALVRLLSDTILDAVQQAVIAAAAHGSEVSVRVLGGRHASNTHTDTVKFTTRYWTTESTLVVVTVETVTAKGLPVL
jgi:hypothetical protein